MASPGRQVTIPPDTSEGQNAQTRSFWWRRQPGHNPHQGDMVIRALVRARLLGMQLLTLEARVVVGTENGQRPAMSPLIHPSYDRNDRSLQSPRTEVVSPGSASGFARAIELLAQGTETLDRIRRPAETKLPGLRGMAANGCDVIHLRAPSARSCPPTGSRSFSGLVASRRQAGQRFAARLAFLPLRAALPAFFLALPLTALALFLAFLPGPMANSLCPEAADAMTPPRRTASPMNAMRHAI